MQKRVLPIFTILPPEAAQEKKDLKSYKEHFKQKSQDRSAPGSFV